MYVPERFFANIYEDAGAIFWMLTIDNAEIASGIPVNVVKHLLLEASNEDARILRVMGRNSTMMQMENLVGSARELEDLEKEYGQVFEEEQIRDLAIRYRLRFLNSKNFIGKMDIQVTAKIKEFAKNYGISLNEANLEYNFYILAEPKAFALKTIRVKRFENLKAALTNAFVDPVLFYQVKPGIFVKVHKWGKDFTIYRRLLGYKWQNPNTVRTFNFCVHFGILSLLTATFLPSALINYPILTLLLVSGLSALIATLRNLAILKEGGILSTSESEYVAEYFTSENWDKTDKLSR